MEFIIWTNREKSIITICGNSKCRSLLGIHLHDTVSSSLKSFTHCYINIFFFEFKILTIET